MVHFEHVKTLHQTFKNTVPKMLAFATRHKGPKDSKVLIA